MSQDKREVKQKIFGEEWSYYDLKAFQTIETFLNTNHDTRSLVRSSSGKLFLYDFHEKMGFPDDEIVEHFFMVQSEEEAKSHARSDIITLKSTFNKFIYIAPTMEIHASQPV